MPKRRSCPLSGTVAKTSAGAVEYVPVARIGNVVQTSGGHGDLAILATTDDSGTHMSLLIANAANRTVKTSFTLPQGTATSGVEAEILTLQEGDTTARRKKLTSLTDVSISPCSVNILKATIPASGAAPKNN